MVGVALAGGPRVLQAQLGARLREADGIEVDERAHLHGPLPPHRARGNQLLLGLEVLAGNQVVAQPRPRGVGMHLEDLCAPVGGGLRGHWGIPACHGARTIRVGGINNLIELRPGGRPLKTIEVRKRRWLHRVARRQHGEEQQCGPAAAHNALRYDKPNDQRIGWRASTAGPSTLLFAPLLFAPLPRPRARGVRARAPSRVRSVAGKWRVE
mmetsp:Transcript_57134/g.180836  ORF Transcript_57134/g.180836 Transcript_57134/m.180836 type:complete len:211 (+) Transcript_57134:853-1485(+)